MSATLTLFLVLLVGGLAGFLIPWPPFEAALAWQRWSAGLRRHALRLNGRKWVYLVGGSGDPVLLIHGFGGDKDNFSGLAGELSTTHRVIVPDLPGFGESDDPDGSFDLDEQTIRVARFLAALQVPKLHVVGNSMGGYIAANLARLAPELVRSVWLIAPAGVDNAERTPLIARASNGDNDLVPETLEEHRDLIESLFGDRFHTPAFVIQGLGKRAVAKRALWLRVFEEAFDEMTPLENHVAALSCPVMVTWGDLDNVLHPSGAPTLVAAGFDVRLDRMEDAGHLPMTEQPRRCAAEWRRWIRSRRS